MCKNVEASIVEQVVVNDTSTNYFIALPTWEPNRSLRHSWKDSATFARVIVSFIIE
jgi:energy-converting hydrogenase Eha subunit A